MDELQTEELLTPASAAAYMRLDKPYFMRLASSGAIACLKPSPRRVLFRKSDLDAWRSGWTVRLAAPFKS